jgi:hypothetical protein
MSLPAATKCEEKKTKTKNRGGLYPTLIPTPQNPITRLCAAVVTIFIITILL